MSDTEFDNSSRRHANPTIVIVVVCLAFAAVMTMRILSPRDAGAGDPDPDDPITIWLNRPPAPEVVIEVIPEGPIAPEGGAPRNPFVTGGPKPPPPSMTPKRLAGWRS